jgi:hypothetical protein
MTASIGITVFGNQRESIEDVLQQADTLFAGQCPRAYGRRAKSMGSKHA